MNVQFHYYYPFLFQAILGLQKISKMDDIQEMVSGLLGFQEDCIQVLKMEIALKSLPTPDHTALAAQRPGYEEDLKDLVMFLTGQGPPGHFDDIMDLDLDSQWSQP